MEFRTSDNIIQKRKEATQESYVPALDSCASRQSKRAHLDMEKLRVALQLRCQLWKVFDRFARKRLRAEVFRLLHHDPLRVGKWFHAFRGLTLETQAQPPERDVACNEDVRVSIIGQLLCTAAVACSDLGAMAYSWLQKTITHLFGMHRRTIGLSS